MQNTSMILSIAIVLILCTMIYLVLQNVKYKDLCNKLNVKILNYYLNQQFINKLCEMIDDQNVRSVNEIMYDIKNYFQFSDVIMYDIHSDDCIFEIANRKLIWYLNINKQRILSVVNSEKISYIENLGKIIYLVKLSRENNHILVLTKENNNFLSIEEHACLECIKSIIKIAHK